MTASSRRYSLSSMIIQPRLMDILDRVVGFILLQLDSSEFVLVHPAVPGQAAGVVPELLEMQDADVLAEVGELLEGVKELADERLLGAEDGVRVDLGELNLVEDVFLAG